MSHRVYLFFALLAVVWFGSLPDCHGQNPKTNTDQKETTYQGKTLSQWIAELKDTDSEVRFNAATVLSAIGPDAKPAVPALIEALKVNGIRKTAAVALGVIGPEAKPAVPALIKGFQDEKFRSN